MYIQQAELLRGMDRNFIKEFLDIATKEFHEGGDFLFHYGEKASYFYILIKGHVKLSIGGNGYVIHVVDRTGEAFGWSSLVGRESYSASAECVVATKVLRIETDRVQEVLEKYPANGMIFFKRLARILGDRLLRSYEAMPVISQADASISFGSGQVVETPAPW